MKELTEIVEEYIYYRDVLDNSEVWDIKEKKLKEIKKYKAKPRVIEAIQLQKNNLDKIALFLEHEKKPKKNKVQDGVSISLNIGDYIIKEADGEYYSCKQDIFERSYKLLED